MTLPLHRQLQVLDIRLDHRFALVADRPGADVDAMLVAVVAATASPFRNALGPRVVVGKRLELASLGARILLARLRRSALEAIEAVDHITIEARLALLAVGD